MHRWTSFAAALLACANSLTAAAQTPLKVLEPAGGGRIVYGTVDGQSSEAGAMGAILRNLHGQYGDRPQVGRPFRVRETNSAAVFFTLVKRTQDNGHIAGLIIAAPAGSGRMEAALLSDDAKRFGSTVNPMLKTLFGVWHPGASAAPDSVPSNAVPAFKRHVLPDNSASVALPDDWRVLPTSGGGSIFAEGPAGEAVALNYAMLAMNSSDPRVRQTMAFAQGAGRNTLYAHSLYYPYGGDLGTAFTALIKQSGQLNNQPPISIQIDSQAPVSAGGARCARLEGSMDPSDGKGPRRFTTLFCQGPLNGTSYMNTAFHSAAPAAAAARSSALRNAIVESFQLNSAVVERQAAALAAPAIEQIHAIGRAAAAQAAASHEASDRWNQGVQERGDSQDKRSQAFSNYLLDQTVIQDNQRSEHATVWNDTAEAIVQSNPNRYSYVETPNFWKGVDY